MKKAFIIVFVLLAMILTAVFVFYKPAKQETTAPVVKKETPKATPPAVTPPPVAVSPNFFPMTGFDSRIKYRWFGKYVDSSDMVPDCGAVFTGYHNADDLEVTAVEKTANVPVYAITDGTVRLKQFVSGYGGLLVLSGTINGQAVTINYGHVRLGSISLNVGDSVKAGQQVALLGTGCSSETAGERKHLHFAIHKGAAVDVRGYLPNQAALSGWIDPKALLDGLKANQPK